MGIDPRMKGARPSMTPEQIMERQFRAKCRFKAAVRFVMINIFWLHDVEDQELGDNIQRNVMLLTRKKDKKGLLSLSDKSILSKPAENRTEEEKIHLNKMIGGLKCFRRYPSHVKRQLAAVTYFVYYGPRRDLIRQGGFATAMYFLISGDVAISQTVFDPVLNQMVQVPLGEMGPGSIFGEVSLLHDIPRTATVTTLNDCELLFLRRDDFNVVLKATVQEQWNEVLAAMDMFTYFDGWDEISKREACILGKIVYFESDQTILGDGVGLTDHVYFVLQGRCRLIEHIHVITEFLNGYKHYRLHIPPEVEPVRKNSNAVNNDNNERKTKRTSITIEDGTSKREPNPEDLKIELINKSLIVLKEESKSGLREQSTTMLSHSSSSSGLDDEGQRSERLKSTMSIKAELNEALEETSGRESKSSSKRKSRASTMSSKQEKLQEEYEPDKQQADAEDFRSRRRSSVKLSRTGSLGLRLRNPPEVHYMQVCCLNPTACFCIGESMKNRRIVAIRQTKCLLIPRYWLMQKNKGNIWNRVQQFLTNHVPTTKQIFKEFVLNRKWMDYRKKTMDDILAKAPIANDNVKANIPYTIRVNEEIIFP